MPKIFDPDQVTKRGHFILPVSDWDDLADIAKKANMTTGGLIRTILQTSLKHFRDQARRAVDEIEKDFEGNITIPNLDEIKQQAKMEQEEQEQKQISE